MSSTDYIVHGPATLWRAPVGEALPADTVGAGTAWGGNWTQLGWTEAPLKFTFTKNKAQGKIQEANAPVKEWVNDEAIEWEVTLAEETNANLQYAIGGTLTTQAADATHHAYTDLVSGGEQDITPYTWGFEWINTVSSLDQPVRMQIYKGTCIAGTPLELDKGKQSAITLKGSGWEDMTKTKGQRLYKIHHITADPTA